MQYNVIVSGEREVGTEDKLILLACQSPGSVQGYGLGSRTRVFDVKFSSAVNCCCFISDTLVACGTDESSISMIDLRNTRSVCDNTGYVLHTDLV